MPLTKGKPPALVTRDLKEAHFSGIAFHLNENIRLLWPVVWASILDQDTLEEIEPVRCALDSRKAVTVRVPGWEEAVVGGKDLEDFHDAIGILLGPSWRRLWKGI